MKVQQYKDILLECLVTLRHARTFVTSREKMHPTGVEIYDKLVTDVENALKAPEPASAQETGTARRCRCGQVEWENGARRISCGDGSDHYVDLDCVSAAENRRTEQ